MSGLHESRNNFNGSFNTYSSRSFTNVAPQSQLGLLSKRWFGHIGAGFTRPGSSGADLSPGA